MIYKKPFLKSIIEKNERGSLAISSVRRGKKPNTHKTNKTRQTNRKKTPELGHVSASSFVTGYKPKKLMSSATCVLILRNSNLCIVLFNTCKNIGIWKEAILSFLT